MELRTPSLYCTEGGLLWTASEALSLLGSFGVCLGTTIDDDPEARLESDFDGQDTTR